eukprot:PLAT15596.1.p2 GENE.PLAT15596.1~~PLAT15596.1.p2  ORF type:complete len:387 (-),score=136.57 PLAT15596.1:1302-2414(-)
MAAAAEPARAPERASPEDSPDEGIYVKWVREQKSRHDGFDVEHWVAPLEEVGKTFKTRTFPLHYERAAAICDFYAALFNNRPLVGVDPLHRLARLQSLLQREMDAMPSDAGYFVRLSGRSPKDGLPLDGRELRESLQPLLPGESELTPNARMRGYCAASSRLLRVQNAADAMHRIVTSERVFVDLNRATALPREEFSISVVLRAWHSGVDGELEFRAFVHDGQLTALSQYNHMIYIDGLAARKEELEQRIRGCWEEVAPLITPSSYVIDFAVIDGEEPDVMVIELNPMDSSTGGGLFSWSRPADAAILNGEAPFQFRVYESEEETPITEDMVDYVTSETVRDLDSVEVPDFVDWQRRYMAATTRSECVLL